MRARNGRGARVLVLSAGVGAGHTMAADALETAFLLHPDVETAASVDVLEMSNEAFRTFYSDGYFRLVKAVPWLVGWGYDANDVPFKLGRATRAMERINTTETVRAIRDFRPTHVVCTHFLPLRLVALLIARGDLRASLSAVTTDYDFQGLWLTGTFDDFFVARTETRDHLAAIGIPPERVHVSGIPVRAGLGDPVDRETVLRRFGLRDDLPVLLISAGAAGGAYIRSIVRQVTRLQSPCQAVVVCGRNTDLREEITALTADAPHIHVLGYTDAMADLMRVAALFVGKPGGLSSSECMAAGTPMVVINPIPGQEVRNSDFLLEEGAAVRCNYETTVGVKIDRLLGDPDRLAAMSVAARRIGHPRAATVVADRVLADRDPALWISHSAQRAIHRATEDGVPAVDHDPRRRVRRLVDVATGTALALVTSRQLEEVADAAASRSADGTRLVIAARRIDGLRHNLLYEPDVLLMLRYLVGSAASIEIRVE